MMLVEINHMPFVMCTCIYIYIYICILKIISLYSFIWDFFGILRQLQI
jgi:hypothetical protein